MGLIKETIEGLVILSVLCGIYGFTNDMMALTGKAQKQGLISYSQFTQLLTNTPTKGTIKNNGQR